MGERTRNAALLEDSGTPQALVPQARAPDNAIAANPGSDSPPTVPIRGSSPARAFAGLRASAPSARSSRSRRRTAMQRSSGAIKENEIPERERFRISVQREA
jgi:hypothetical protein